MLKKYLEGRHINLWNGYRSSLSLEPEFWTALEVLAYEDGWHDWRDFFYAVVLEDKPDDMPMASYVRRYVTSELFIEYDKSRAEYKIGLGHEGEHEDGIN